MLWLIFLLPAGIFGWLVFQFPGWGNATRGALVCLVGILQFSVLEASDPNWTRADNAAMGVLVVAIPWIGAFLLSALCVKSGKKYRALIGIPLCYLLLFGLGVGLGDALGLIPQ